MALRYQFKPGLQQSVEAHSYFRSLAADLVGKGMLELRPMQYLFEECGHPPLSVRVWAATGHGKVRTLLPWLRATLERVHALRRPRVDIGEVCPR